VCYNRAAYRSGVWESYWDDDGPESYLKDWPLRYWLIHQQNVDPFAVVIPRCREKRISPWVSIRMNDTHYLDDPSRISRLWLDHPEFRTHERGGFDFSHLEVRRHYLAITQELLERYGRISGFAAPLASDSCSRTWKLCAVSRRRCWIAGRMRFICSTILPESILRSGIAMLMASADLAMFWAICSAKQGRCRTRWENHDATSSPIMTPCLGTPTISPTDRGTRM
jgi:hypothetical protein